jgi:hypothetical protein
MKKLLLIKRVSVIKMRRQAGSGSASGHGNSVPDVPGLGKTRNSRSPASIAFVPAVPDVPDFLKKFILPPSTWLPILQFFLSDFALKPGRSGTSRQVLEINGLLTLVKN